MVAPALQCEPSVLFPSQGGGTGCPLLCLTKPDGFPALRHRGVTPMLLGRRPLCGTLSLGSRCTYVLFSKAVLVGAV